MSRQAIETFMNHLADDQALRARLAEALEERSDDDTGAAVVAFANEAGFEVTDGDLLWLQGALTENLDNDPPASPDQLSDKALDEVNGGFMGAISYVGNKLRPGAPEPSKDQLNPLKKAFWF